MAKSVVRLEGSPISGMLRRFQTSAGWSDSIDDGLKARIIARLAKIVDSDETPPNVQVAAASCLMRASQVENEVVNTMIRALEATELTERIANIERHLLDITPGRQPDLNEIDVLGEINIDSEQPINLDDI